MRNESKWMVVSDLDGTLLNHVTYAFDDALPVLQMLKEKNIPVILNTSKTYDEMRQIRQEIGIVDPFIVENGSCIYVPIELFPEKPINAVKQDGIWEIELGKSIQYIDRALNDLEEMDFSYTRLSQCSIEKVQELTGLSRSAATRAKNRKYSEPISWHDGNEKLVLFKQHLERRQLKAIRGGRFIHVQGMCDKGLALQALLRLYPGGTKTIVLGDSENDLDMLAIADISTVIKSPSNTRLHGLFTPHIQSTLQAPAGWSEAIIKALSMIETNNRGTK